MARIQRVVNTCWLSEKLGQLPAGAHWRGERGSERQTEGESRGKDAVCVSACVRVCMCLMEKERMSAITEVQRSFSS